MTCREPSLNDTESVYGPTLEKAVTRWMGCVIVLPEWVDLDGWLTRLQECPVGGQLSPVNLGPRFNQAHLGPGQFATEHLKGIDRQSHRVVLVVRMKMRAMVGPASTNIPAGAHPSRGAGRVQAVVRPCFWRRVTLLP